MECDLRMTEMKNATQTAVPADRWFVKLIVPAKQIQRRASAEFGFQAMLAGSLKVMDKFQVPYNLTDINSNGVLSADWVASGNYSNNFVDFLNTTSIQSTMD